MTGLAAAAAAELARRTGGAPPVSSSALTPLQQAAAAELANRVKNPSAADAPQSPAYNPAADRETLQLGPFDTHVPLPVWLNEGLEGAGKTFTDFGLGAKQIGAGVLAKVDPRFRKTTAQLAQEAADKRTADAPLMSTWGGWAGAQAPGIAAAFIPGVGEIRGAALLGAGLGALTPTAPGESRLLNTAIGGGLGAVGGAIGNKLGGFLASRTGLLGGGLTDAQRAALQGGENLGMRVTPGQRAGSKPLQQLEAKLQSQPWTSGPFNHVAQGNQAALNRTAAQSIGETGDILDSTVLGRANDRLGETFENVRSPNRAVEVDPAATRAFLDNLDAESDGLLPGDMAIRDNKLVGQLDNLMQRSSGAQPNRDAFLSDFERISQESPHNPAGRLMNGNVSVEVVRDPVDPNAAHIEDFRALTTGKQYGPAALRRITNLADQHGVRLTLDANPLDTGGIPKDKLVALYEQHGFHAVPDEWRPNLMERKPQTQGVTAKQLGQLSSKLGKAAYKQMVGPAGDRDLGKALYAVKDHVDDLLENGLSPEERAEYQAARQQYRNLMTLTSRGSIVNPNTGHVSGGALASKLQQADRPGFLFGKNQTPLYRAARFAQAFKPIVGDSGTATRLGGHGVLPLALTAIGAHAAGIPFGGDLAAGLALPFAGNLASRFYLSGPGSAIVRGVIGAGRDLSRGTAATSRGVAPAARYLTRGGGFNALPWMRAGMPLPGFLGGTP